MVESWAWPDPFAEVSPQEAKEVQCRIAKGDWRADYRSTNWAGIAVAEVLGFDLSRPGVRASVQSILKTWIGTGALREADRLDGPRKPRRFVEVGEMLP